MIAVEISKINETRIKAEITANEAEVKPAQEKAEKQIQSLVELPGFRKGKAPLHMVKQKFTGNILEETMRTLIFESAAEIEKKSPERLYELVKIENFRTKSEKMLFDVIYDLAPYVKLPKLKTAEPQRYIAQISDADVESDIYDTRYQHATFEEKTDVAAEEKDQLTVDFEIWIDDAPSGEVTKDYVFILGKGNLHRELEADIIARHGKVGEEFKNRKEIPAAEDNLARNYEIIATITKIEKPKLPELTDEWVKNVVKRVDTVAAWKNKLKDEIERRFAAVNFQTEVTHALEALRAKSEFFFSESYLSDHVEEFCKERKIERSDLSEAQVSQIRDMIKTQNNPTVLYWTLLRLAEKNQQKRNKNQKVLDDLFKDFVIQSVDREEERVEIRSSIVDALMKAYEEMQDEKKGQTMWDYLIPRYVESFHYDLLFNFFDDEGIAKKGRKMTFQELKKMVTGKKSAEA